MSKRGRVTTLFMRSKSIDYRDWLDCIVVVLFMQFCPAPGGCVFHCSIGGRDYFTQAVPAGGSIVRLVWTGPHAGDYGWFWVNPQAHWETNIVR